MDTPTFSRKLISVQYSSGYEQFKIPTFIINPIFQNNFIQLGSFVVTVIYVMKNTRTQWDFKAVYFIFFDTFHQHKTANEFWKQ